MSGGALNDFYGQLQDHEGDFGDKELDDLVKDLAELFHEREWFLSADTGEGSWEEARAAFKEKWFTQHGREERIEKYLDELREEIRRSFMITEKRCKNCAHWTREEEKDSRYGWCEFKKHCLMHRSEWCEKFEKKGEN